MADGNLHAEPCWALPGLDLDVNCSQLYLGIDRLLPECDGDMFAIERSPSASAEAIAIRGVLGTEYIYYLAPHTGCGCGWDYFDVGGPCDEKNKASCDLLRTFLRSVGPCKIYSVCIDSIGVSPESEIALSVDAFMDNICAYRVPYASDVGRVYAIGAAGTNA